MAGLYVHIPFCKRKCRYCDFPSYAGEERSIPAYLEALHKELEFYATSPASPLGASLPAFSSIYFGGGTPSLLPIGAISDLLSHIRARLSIAPNAEISLECNPGAVTLEKLREYRVAGVNRLSIGLQCAQDTLLRRLGRIHTRAQFEETYALCRKAGFENVNIDVMHGLPGQAQADYLATLAFVCALKPEHISAYSLILEEGTPLYDAVNAGRESLPDPDAVADMQDAGMQFLCEAGYARYEISNFSRPGFCCRHNMLYWQNGAYLGMGAGAHSAWHVQGQWSRFARPAGLDAYCKSVEQAPALNPVSQSEEMFETVMLGLRMVKGLSLQAFASRFGLPFSSAYPQAIPALQAKKWLAIDDDTAFLTPAGMDFQNSALLYFLEEQDRSAHCRDYNCMKARTPL